MPTNKPIKILLTGGGTAGHISPIVALSQSLDTNKRVKVLYVGSRTGLDRELASKYKLNFKGIFTGKRRNYFSLSNGWDLFKIFIGIVQSYFIVKFYSPNVVFSKGGYVSYPILFWVKRFKIPLVIHESDSVLGKANVYALKFAKKVCLGFPLDSYQDIPLEKSVYTGIPVRREFFGGDITEENTILITGGSQGSQILNKRVLEILDELLKKYKIIHIVGKNNIEKIKEEVKMHVLRQNPNYELIDFTEEMPLFMKRSSLIISRAGANTLAEISATGKPAILVPLTTASADHQSKNAQIYQDHNAAVVLSEGGLTGSSLLSIINQLMTDENTRKLIGHHAEAFARRDSVEEIIEILFQNIKR